MELDSLQPNNEIIAYINGKAIVLNDNGDLFYAEMPEEFVTIGGFIFSGGLSPLSELPSPEQRLIKKHLDSIGG